jgi:hypothetical protein
MPQIRAKNRKKKKHKKTQLKAGYHYSLWRARSRGSQRDVVYLG